MTADDQRARRLLVPLGEMPGSKALQRELCRHIGGDQGELLGAIARAEAALQISKHSRAESRR